MKPKNLILLFIFGLFLFFLLPNFAEAACPLSCSAVPPHTNCSYMADPIGGCNCERLGLTGYVDYQDQQYCAMNCTDGSGKCKCNAFFSGYNGQSCTAIDRKWSFPATCTDCVKTGDWDYSDSKCVECSGKIENRILGNTFSVSDACEIAEGIPAGDGKCESACGASSQCDEKTYGAAVPVSGGECRYCVFYETKPDLVITDIRPDGSTVKYTVKNQGNALAGSSNSYLYVDGSYKASDSVSSLSAGSSATDTFSYNWIENCTGSTVTIKVCADGGGAVAESNEGNNCLPEIWDCPKPDLYVTDFWDDDGFVRYTIRNKGEVDAGPSYTKLYVDGAFEESESLSSLSAGNSKTRSFDYDWIENCTGNSDTIEVCADKAGPNGAAASGGGDVDESNENNNCSDDVWYCLKPDLIIVDIWFESDKKVHYTILNQGEAEADSSQSALYVNGSYKTYDSVSSILAGSYSYEYFSGWTCTAGQTYSIEACADRNDSVDEEDEYNNCLTETLDCPGECTGTLSVSISGAGTCTVTASLTATLCDGKFWQVKDDGTTKCSGTVSGSPYYYTCSSWTVETGSYLYRLYVDGAIKDGKSVNCSETPNEPPICNYLDASPASGDAPLNVSFTGSGSDSDGNIVEYQLDFDGDGTWDYTGSVSPAEPNPVIGYNYTYDTPGTYPAKIRFKDDDGAWSDVPSACTQVISVTEPGVALNPPAVITGEASPVEATSATLNGSLVGLGYDSAECPSCSCIVWFEWGTSGTEGVSDSYGNKTTPVPMTDTGAFTKVISGLDSGVTYYFEAFAKNGGSW